MFVFILLSCISVKPIILFKSKLTKIYLINIQCDLEDTLIPLYFEITEYCRFEGYRSEVLKLLDKRKTK